MKAMINISTPRRIAAALVLLPVLAVVLAACGGPGQGVSPVPAPTPTGKVAACDVRRLQVLLDPSATLPQAKGGSYMPIDFVNNSTTNCEIAGFPGVVAMTASGRGAIAANLPVRGLGGRLLLAPQYTAHAWLLLANAPQGATGGCRLFNTAGMRVSLPGTAGFVWLRWRLHLCVPPKTAAISVQAVQQGIANVTTFP